MFYISATFIYLVFLQFLGLVKFNWVIHSMNKKQQEEENILLPALFI